MTDHYAPSFAQERATARIRVRLAMYLAFALLALAALGRAWVAHRHEQLHLIETELLSLVGQERSVAQQIRRLATMAGDGHLAELGTTRRMMEEALVDSHHDAQRIDALLAQLRELSKDGFDAGEPVMTAWLQARERLWASSEALVPLLQDDRRMLLAGAAAAVERESTTAYRAVQALYERRLTDATAGGRHQMQLLEGGAALTLAVLVMLALFVVEPTARAVDGQVQRLADQAATVQRLALVAERTDNMVIITRADRAIEWVNDAFARRTGYSMAEAVGRHPGPLLFSELNDRETRRRLGDALRAGESVRAELCNRAKDGTDFWVDADFQPVRDAEGQVLGWVTVATDITERRRLQEQLSHSARTDSLTGLPNRAVVLERVKRALDHAARSPDYGFAVLFMDFDRFKQVNDTLGHAAGDELLRQISQRLDSTLRSGDAVARVSPDRDVAARVGGDEFVVVLDGIQTDEAARHVGERLLQALGEPYQVCGHMVQSSASIGIVTSRHAAVSAEVVLRDADTAMYEAKRAGRGRCVLFDASMQERVVQMLQTERELRRALRDGELFCVYQPVVELAGGQLRGVEALVRWRHPQRGVVSPAHFIGLAEEAGLIDEVGRQVLHSACRQFAAWRSELGDGAPRLLAVNLSRAQLKQPGLVGEVREVLRACAMRPGELQLEVTETLAAQDEQVQETLRELKALGVTLALDDFGTGYSSLACLHQLPVDTVKIDRSFVAHAETQEYHRVLIEATIRVARTLGMSTVAEGIETAGQAALMEALCCDRGQGYHFARPLTADELRDFVRSEALLAP